MSPPATRLLWTPPLHATPLGEKLSAAHGLFLSKKAKHTFSGYALAQLKRIRTHHRWLDRPPAAPPVRADFGLPDRTVIPKDQLAAAQAAITKKLAHWELDFLDDVDPSSRILLQYGAWSYEQLVAWAEQEDEALDALHVSSTLPHVPDRAALDRLCVELVEASLV